MGDFISPKRRDVFQRLRRRIDSYRQRQGDCLSHYQPHLSGMYEHQIQETSLLHQKWLDSKVKRHNSRKSSSKDESSSFEDRSYIASARQKRKHDYLKTPDDSTLATEADIQGKVPADEKKLQDPQLNGHLPINNRPDPQPDMKPLETPTSVSTNIPPARGTGLQQDKNTNMDIRLSENEHKHFAKGVRKTFCKEEPVDISEPCHSSNSSHNSFPDIEDVDELQAILESLTEDGNEEMHAEFMKDIDLVVGSCAVESKNKNKSLKSPEFDKKNNGNQCSIMGQEQMFDSQTSGKFVDPRLPSMNFGTSQAACIHPENPEALRSTQPLLGDTGPAAETLKQMAAQHQSQESSHYGKAGNQDPYNQKVFRGPMVRDGAQQQFHFNAGNTYNSGHMVNQPFSEEAKMPVPNSGLPQMGMGMNYGETKPLTHYGGNLVSVPSSVPSMTAEQPSSLQQLQNQVHSHFNQGANDRPGSSPFMNHSYSSANNEMHTNPQMSATHMNIHGPVHDTSRFVSDSPMQVPGDKKQEAYTARIMTNANLPQSMHNVAKPGNVPGVTTSMYAMDKKPVMSLPPHMQQNPMNCAPHINKRHSMDGNFPQQQSYGTSDQAKAYPGLPTMNPDCPTSLPYPGSVNEMNACPPNMQYVQKPNIPMVNRQYSEPWNSGCGKVPGGEEMHPMMPMRPVQYGGYSGPPMTSTVNCEVQNSYSNTNHERPPIVRNDGSVPYNVRNCYNAPAGSNQGTPNDRKMMDMGNSSRANVKTKLKPPMGPPHMAVSQFHGMTGGQEHGIGHPMYPVEHNQNYSSPPAHNFM